MDSLCNCYSGLAVCYFKNNSLKQREISPSGLAGTWQDHLPLISLGKKRRTELSFWGNDSVPSSRPVCSADGTGSLVISTNCEDNVCVLLL